MLQQQLTSNLFMSVHVSPYPLQNGWVGGGGKADRHFLSWDAQRSVRQPNLPVYLKSWHVLTSIRIFRRVLWYRQISHRIRPRVLSWTAHSRSRSLEFYNSNLRAERHLCPRFRCICPVAVRTVATRHISATKFQADEVWSVIKRSIENVDIDRWTSCILLVHE